MKKLLAAATIVVGVCAGNSVGHAAFSFTDGTFFKPTVDGTMTFTFEGHDAAYLDTMIFAIDLTTIFDNHAGLGAAVSIPVTANQTYKLSLITPVNVPDWSSDPSLNSDGLKHLAYTNSFLDFTLPGFPNAPTPISTNCAIVAGCYLGWEDLAPRSDGDFNDLVFALQFTPTADVPEPASLALVGGGLLGFAAIRRLRNRRKTRCL